MKCALFNKSDHIKVASVGKSIKHCVIAVSLNLLGCVTVQFSSYLSSNVMFVPQIEGKRCLNINKANVI